MGIMSRVVDFSPSARHEQVSVSSVQHGEGRTDMHAIGQCSVSSVRSLSCLPSPTYPVHLAGGSYP